MSNRASRASHVGKAVHAHVGQLRHPTFLAQVLCGLQAAATRKGSPLHGEDRTLLMHHQNAATSSSNLCCAYPCFGCLLDAPADAAQTLRDQEMAFKASDFDY